METPFPKLEPPKEHAVRRLKYIWRAFLIANLGIGAYMFGMARKRDMNMEKGKASAAKPQSDPIHEELAPVTEEPLPAPIIEEPAAIPIVQLMKERTPLHDDQKRQLFEWMLEEKRMIRPKDRLEKKRIDEEKAILKQFIRVESIPDL